MTVSTLEQQRKKLEQRKAQLAQQEARLKLKERKLQLSRHIKIGELAEKAEISQLDLPILLGAFLSIKKQSIDPLKLKEWEKLGASLNSDL